MSTDGGFEVKLTKPYQQVMEEVIGALKTQGFGVLTQIDVKATLKEKLGIDFHPYAILGACNPPLAHRALSADASIGLMLPCNVTVEASPDGFTLVRIADPESMMMVGEFANNPALREVAQEARARLLRVAQALNT